MARIESSSDWMSCQLFMPVPDVELREILDVASAIYNANPGIEAAILLDQERAAKEKRALRDADKLWELTRRAATDDAHQSLFSLPAPALPDVDRGLEVGCPRMAPALVFVLLVCRGRWGSITDQPAQERLRDSMTLRAFLDAHGFRLPARSTVHENLNVISKQTLELILTAEMRLALEEGLDDFCRYFLDSTSVEANSCWPTDSGNLSRALHRAFRCGQKLDLVGLPVFRKWTMPRWLRRMRKLDFEINITAGKPNSRKKVESLYREQAKLAGQLVRKLAGELDVVRAHYDPEQLLPSLRVQCENILGQITADCSDAQTLIRNIQMRVFEKLPLKSSQRIPSLSDRSAAFICKGDRLPVVGYRPQVVRSGKGLVVHLGTPEGNAADSGQLVDCVDAAIRRTDCAPFEVSVDDGYASAPGKAALEELGVEVVSISGSKGRKLTPEADWESDPFCQSRNDRSAVESLMFSLKYTVEFGRVRRRGIEAVRCELLEKVIAYNLARIILLRKRKEPDLKAAA